jgi:hypothetical protein
MKAPSTHHTQSPYVTTVNQTAAVDEDERAPGSIPAPHADKLVDW